jgi:type II secretory pathway predicted ATPase ExeA
MYLDYYGLSKQPFHITPDSYFFYMSPSHKESYASLIYGLNSRKGFVSLTGEVGLGKTTVVRTFLNKCLAESRIKPVFVFNSNLSFKGLLLTIYSELGLDLPSFSHLNTDDKNGPLSLSAEDEIFELVRQLSKVLIEEYQKGHNVILVIDDAQNMPMSTLENLRMLSNIETGKDKLLQIFLIGQTELDSMLDKRELRQLKQRLAIRTTLKPLSKKQCREYIRHRLEKAGAKSRPEKIFTRGALREIYKHSKGIPRKINIICDNAMITGFGYGQKTINSKIVREVRADFEGRRFKPVFRYAMAGCLTLALISAGLWFSPYRDNFSAGIKELSPRAINPAAETIDSQPESLTQFSKSSLMSNEPGPVLNLPQEPVQDSGHETIALDPEATDPVPDEPGGDMDLPMDGPIFQELDDIIPEHPDIHNQLSQLIPTYHGLSPTRQEVLIRMAGQMSTDVLLTFKRMLAALELEDYQEAARQMENSRWAETVGDYAFNLAEAMRTDEPGW